MTAATLEPLGTMRAEPDAVTLHQPDAGALAARPRRRRFRMWFVHSSGRFDRSVAVWRASLSRLRKLGSVVTGTEAAGRSRSVFASALGRVGWDYAHLSGAAVGECYASWDGTVLEPAAHPFARKLTDMTWTRAPEFGGAKAAKVHALVVPLRTRTRGGRMYVLVVVHWPLDNTEQRAAVWRDVCEGIRDLQRDLEARWPDADVVVVGDVNKNLRQHNEAAQVRQRLEWAMHTVVSWRPPFPSAGTHGSQLIDMAFARAGVIRACELVADDASSDHRPFRYRLRGWLLRVLTG